jgi:hypothetical protein
MTKHDELSEIEVAQRRDAAISRALNTRPKSSREMVGKMERAQARRETKAIRKIRVKPKDNAAS